jgi:hypothetical protein
VDARASSAFYQREMEMAGKPSPLPIYHLRLIIQPTTNEKPRLCRFRGFSLRQHDHWFGCDVGYVGDHRTCWETLGLGSGSRIRPDGNCFAARRFCTQRLFSSIHKRAGVRLAEKISPGLWGDRGLAHHGEMAPTADH